MHGNFDEGNKCPRAPLSNFNHMKEYGQFTSQCPFTVTLVHTVNLIARNRCQMLGLKGALRVGYRN